MGECKHILNLYDFFSFYFKRSITNAWLPIMTVLNIIVPAESSESSILMVGSTRSEKAKVERQEREAAETQVWKTWKTFNAHQV